MNLLFIGNGFDIAHGIKIEFKSFVESILFKSKIGNSYKKFFTDNEYKKFDKNNTNLWSEFEEYLKHVCDQNPTIKAKYFIFKISFIFKEWLKKENTQLPNKETKIKQIIDEINPQSIISFNFTYTSEIYGYQKKFFDFNSNRSDWGDWEKNNKKFINIHFYENNKAWPYILGHDGSEKITKNLFISKWNERKDFNPKVRLLETIIKNNKIKNLWFFGFSFGDSDANVNEFCKDFIKKDRERKIIIYYKFKPPKNVKESKKIKFIKI